MPMTMSTIDISYSLDFHYGKQKLQITVRFGDYSSEVASLAQNFYERILGRNKDGKPETLLTELMSKDLYPSEVQHQQVYYQLVRQIMQLKNLEAEISPDRNSVIIYGEPAYMDDVITNC